MLIYWVSGWELLLECDTGQRKRDRSYIREKGRRGGSNVGNFLKPRGGSMLTVQSGGV